MPGTDTSDINIIAGIAPLGHIAHIVFDIGPESTGTTYMHKLISRILRLTDTRLLMQIQIFVIKIRHLIQQFKRASNTRYA